MIVLDTNVISEVLRARPEPRVASWLGDQSPSAIFITTITQAELLYGLELLPVKQRRHGLAAAVEEIVRREFRGRVLPFDGSAADTYATIAATRRINGKPITAFDAQIAAIARSRGAQVATRNIKDFEDCGIELLNPWDAPL